MASQLRLAWVYLKLILGLLLVGITLIFVTQNAEVVLVQFLVWDIQMSQSLLIFSALTIGVLAGFLMTGWIYWRRTRGSRKKRLAP
jgi:uncharacterized integral membrane protein